MIEETLLLVVSFTDSFHFSFELLLFVTDKVRIYSVDQIGRFQYIFDYYDTKQPAFFNKL